MPTMSRLPRIVPAALLATLALLVGGCANLVRYPASGDKIVVAEMENVWVTGSHIPMRVPKGISLRSTPSISPMTILTPDDIRRGNGPSVVPMHE